MTDPPSSIPDLLAAALGRSTDGRRSRTGSDPVRDTALVSAPAVSRRSLLRGAVALGAFGAAGGLGLAACGSTGEDQGSGTDGGLRANDEGSEPSGWSLVSMTDTKSALAAGEEARVVFGIGDVASGGLVVDAPESLVFRVLDDNGREVVGDMEVPRHDEGLPRAYFPVRFTPATKGVYTARTEVEGAEIEALFEVSALDSVVVPRPGRPFPSAQTPTTADPDGVDPVCTRDPGCGLHTVDVAAALGTKPLAILVSTPAFCTSAICGPVLDVLLGAQPSAPNVTFVHVEVYASAEEVGRVGVEGQPALAPAVETWKLPYEPCLFLVGSDGTLHDRLDVIFDGRELAASLAALT